MSAPIIAKSDSSFALAWRLARREMKGSLSKFRIFLSALVLGVASIGAVGSVAESMRTGIGDNARILLGGDLEISSRHTAVEQDILKTAQSFGTATSTVEMRAMLRNPANDERKLVELKAVDSAWPLIGTAKIDGPDSLAQGLAKGSVLLQPSLMRSLSLSIGDEVKLGEATLTVAGSLISEPDRTVNFGGFGPSCVGSRRYIGTNSPCEAWLFYQLSHKITFNDPSSSDLIKSQIEPLLKQTHARIRDVSSAAPGFDAFIARAEAFDLGWPDSLVNWRAWCGVCRACVVAIAHAGHCHFEMFGRTICPDLSSLSVANHGHCHHWRYRRDHHCRHCPCHHIDDLITLYCGAPVVAIFPQPLFVAGSFGLLTAFIFTVLPLSRAKDIRASQLFRALITPPTGMPGFGIVIRMLLAAIALTILALIATNNMRLTFGFIGGAVAL